MLRSCVDVIGTKGEEIKIPIHFQLLGMHEALEKNFDWIVSENPFDESSEPKSVERGSSKTYIDKIQFLVEIFQVLILMLLRLKILDSHFLLLAQRR
jgi:hypothetical protein